MRITSGVAGFDGLVRGGFPLGASIVLQGPPGNEKDVFAYEFLAEGLRSGAAALIALSSTSPEQFLESLSKFGVDV